MFETTTTRHNPLIDPSLTIWSWEIPVYLFLGGLVAGMLVLAGWHLLQVARGRAGDVYPVQTPLAAFVLINLGMLALFLDLTHKLYVWRLYLTLEPRSPMSWGAWILLLVYPVLFAGVLLDPPARLLEVNAELSLFHLARLQAHLVVRVEADSACQTLHRAVQDSRLHGISITVIRMGVEFGFCTWRSDHEFVGLRQFGLAALFAFLAGLSRAPAAALGPCARPRLAPRAPRRPERAADRDRGHGAGGHAGLQGGPRARRLRLALERGPVGRVPPRVPLARGLRAALRRRRHRQRHHRGLLYGEGVQFGIYAWWTFRYCGHAKSCVLDGARYRWANEGHPLVTEAPPPATPVTYRPAARNEAMRIHRDEVRALLGDPGVAILDGRSPEEYSGERVAAYNSHNSGAVRAGRIPCAKHIYFEDLLNADKSFKPRAELERLFRAAGAAPDKTAVAYCRMSHRATVLYFALTELLGRDKVRTYDGSWTEWGNLVDFPIER